MRPSSLYSIQQPPQDPYRNRRCYTKETTDEESASTSPTTPTKSTTQLILKTEEPGRTHSYLPYSNHPPDLIQSIRAELYIEKEFDRNNSIMTQEDPPTHRCVAGLNRDISLTDKLRHHRQKSSHNTTTRCRLLILFITLLCFGLITYFVWPRIPKLMLQSEKVERIGDPADWGPTQQPWLRASWRLNMTFDNSVNFVTTHVQNIELVLLDRDTKKPFGWSRTGTFDLAPYKETMVSLVFKVDYESISVNDTTFKNLYNACGPQIPTESPTLNLTMQATVSIIGIIWQTLLLVHPPEGGLYCPFN